MKFLAAAASLLAVATAAPTFSQSPIPGYPFSLSSCLTDAQANFIANVFVNILSNTNRKAAAAAAATLAAPSYTDWSDSINILAGYPIGQPATNGAQAFIEGVYANTPVHVTTLDVFHDCNKLSWRWQINGMGTGQYRVQGIDDITVIPKTGQVLLNYIEFNTIAWGTDTGGQYIPPPAQS